MTEIAWPCLIVELDTTGVTAEDVVIHVVCKLVDKGEAEELAIVDSYRGYQEVDRASSSEALAFHGITKDFLKGRALDLVKVREMVGRAGSIVTRHTHITSTKLSGLVPECLGKRWYPYPGRIQGFPGELFPADERMDVLTGKAESFGFGRLHPLSELQQISVHDFNLTFGDAGPPEVTVRFGRRKVLEAFPAALLKCEVGVRFRLHGKADYDFITAYVNDHGPAFRERAFRLANTPSNQQLVREHHLDLYLEDVEGLIYTVGIRDAKRRRST